MYMENYELFMACFSAQVEWSCMRLWLYDGDIITYAATLKAGIWLEVCSGVVM